MKRIDVLIVGGGAAGLSAALVLLRARRTVAIVDAGEPRNAPAAHLHGFLSRDGAAPAALLASGREEVAGYGGTIIEGRVAELSPGFLATLDGRRLEARRVLISTGLRDEIPDIPHLRERWGRDVLHCPYCHGYEVRDRALGVIGGTAASVAHALLIAQWSDDVVYFPHTRSLTADEQERLDARGVRVHSGEVARAVVSADRLQGVELSDGTRVERTAVFVRPEMRGHDALLRALGCETDENGWVRHDSGGRTSVPGVFVAGNVADPRAQLITAAGQGSAAAIALNADLTDDDLAAQLAIHRGA
ncbi:NAD(P)/FAD-dependent oxidoreductase [Microbacterium sp. BLY]|uniref:NAD(P)/FAD-dependent oxidoreductase n=1 Tax=Microbacterium sp. BLY TaxID=2823280 RepID=UPI001B33C033|nr:NAD(P)/FAD-dependent oxidoreductase [Microbacterium sp. BLY]MBP3977071.1 NAD(P)/FAD-dependent oxidoreductase [Microbacterium sp. BLY]